MNWNELENYITGKLGNEDWKNLEIKYIEMPNQKEVGVSINIDKKGIKYLCLIFPNQRIKNKI